MPSSAFDPDTVRLGPADEITGARRVLAGSTATPIVIGFVQPDPGHGRRWTATTQEFTPIGGGPWRTRHEALLRLVEHALRSTTR